MDKMPSSTESSPPVTGQTTPTFHLFPFLPKEIRDQLWKDALIPFNTRRIIVLRYDRRIYDYRCLNKATLKLENPHLIVQAIGEACQKGQRVVNCSMSEDERQYHTRSTFLEDTINTSRDIFFFKGIGLWSEEDAGTWPRRPVFLPFADKAQKWGRYDINQYGQLRNIMISIPVLKRVDRCCSGLCLGLISGDFATELAQRSFTIRLDKSDNSHISFDDLETTMLDINI